MHRDAHIEGLKATPGGVAMAKAGAHGLQNFMVRSDGGTDDCQRAASSRTWRIWAPPGTSPAPVCPASSVSTTTLRVKKGAWAPLRFSNMLSLPATGITRMLVIRGEEANSLLLCTTESISDLSGPVGSQRESMHEPVRYSAQ